MWEYPSAYSSSTYTKIGTQSIVTWALQRDDTQIPEALRIFHGPLASLVNCLKHRFTSVDSQRSSWFAVSWWTPGRLQIHLASQNLTARRPFFRSVFSLSYLQALLMATRLVLARPTTAKDSSQKDDFCYSSVKDDQSCFKVVTEDKQG